MQTNSPKVNKKEQCVKVTLEFLPLFGWDGRANPDKDKPGGPVMSL